MAEIEKVIKDLEDMRESFLTKTKFEILEARTTLKRAIHIIRELQSSNISFQHTINKLFESLKKADEQIPKWHLCKEELPNESGEYIVATTNGRVTIYGFTTDAYRLSIYDFDKYEGQKKALFYGYDSEWGYSEAKHIIAWTELPKFEGVE